jgi:hypothetical protein
MAHAALFHLSLWFDIFAIFITRKCVCFFISRQKMEDVVLTGGVTIGYIIHANTFPPPPSL